MRPSISVPPAWWLMENMPPPSPRILGVKIWLLQIPRRRQVTPFSGCQTLKGRVMPKGKVYLVNLPIVRDIPALREVSLYAHRSLNHVSGPYAWAVTEASTGMVICHARTRKLALSIAQTRILKAGNEHFLRSIKAVLNNITEATDAPTKTV